MTVVRSCSGRSVSLQFGREEKGGAGGGDLRGDAMLYGEYVFEGRIYFVVSKRDEEFLQERERKGVKYGAPDNNNTIWWMPRYLLRGGVIMALELQ